MHNGNLLWHFIRRFAPPSVREIYIHTAALIVLMDAFYMSIFRLWMGYFYSDLEPWPSPVSCSLCLGLRPRCTFAALLFLSLGRWSSGTGGFELPEGARIHKGVMSVL